MKIFSLFFAFALAQDDSERGKNDADEKGAQMCQGVKVSKLFSSSKELLRNNCPHKINVAEKELKKSTSYLKKRPKIIKKPVLMVFKFQYKT